MILDYPIVHAPKFPASLCFNTFADPLLLAQYFNNPIKIEVTQDSRPLLSVRKSRDVLQHQGKAIVCVDALRSYALVNNPGVRSHQLHPIATDPEFMFNAFSFGSCLSGGLNHATRVKE